MKTIQFALALAFAFVAGALVPAKAQQTSAAVGGVTMSLSTSGFTFVNPAASTTPVSTSATAGVRRSAVAALPPSFVASVALVNHSAAGIAFDFPTQPTAANRFVFSIFDQDGNLIWRSSPAVPASAAAIVTPGIFPATLAAKSAWRQTALIPLIVGGQHLAPGTYRLNASVNGIPVFDADASFVVASTVAPPSSGVKGTVFAGPITPVATAAGSSEKPVPGAIVQYSNAVSAGAALMTVIADGKGQFQFTVPPGTYSVSATIPGDQGKSFGHGTQMVTVTAGRVTSITFHLDTGIR
jgi:Carboxypeptidase regulatory-like domain